MKTKTATQKGKKYLFEVCMRSEVENKTCEAKGENKYTNKI